METIKFVNKQFKVVLQDKHDEDKGKREKESGLERERVRERKEERKKERRKNERGRYNEGKRKEKE